MHVVMQSIAAGSRALLMMPSRADDTAPKTSQTDPQPADDGQPAIALMTCLKLGFAEGSAWAIQCAMELSALIRRDPSRPLEKRQRARIAPRLDFGAVCNRYYQRQPHGGLEEGSVDLAVFVAPDTRVKTAVVLKWSGHEQRDLTTLRCCLSAAGRCVPVAGAPVGSGQVMLSVADHPLTAVHG